MKNKGNLHLVVTPIGNLNEFNTRAIEILNNVDIIACEDTRNSLKLLSHFDIHKKTITYHNFNEENSTKGIISLLNEGKDIALISDAGYPLISDPGYALVSKAIEEDILIDVIGGNNAALNALVASGLDTTHYLFFGFLNPKASSAKKQLEELKDLSYTLIFYEAPHRINKTVKILYEILGDRKICIARELSKIHEEYIRINLKDYESIEEIKGEIVIVVEGNNNKKEDDIEELLKRVKELVSNGLKVKDACEEVSRSAFISKNQLYNLYIKNE